MVGKCEWVSGQEEAWGDGHHCRQMSLQTDVKVNSFGVHLAAYIRRTKLRTDKKTKQITHTSLCA